MAGLQVGDPLPRFTLPDQDGRPFAMQEALGKGALVVFFYPKDQTPGCTAEVCEFRDVHAELAAAGATVVGISSDSVASHRRFASKHQLPYRLLADEGGLVRKQFGTPRALLGLLEGRVTYVADAAGVIRYRFEHLRQATRHVEEALEAVRQLGRPA